MCSLGRGRWRALVAVIVWLVPAVVAAENVAVEWDPSEGATGYKVRWGTALGSYPNVVDVGNTTTYVIQGLTAGGTYWAVAQAYNDSEVSEFSDPLKITVPGGTVECTYSITPASTSISAAGGSGSVTVTTQAGCAWNATTSSGFLTLQNGTGRTGSGSVGYTVAANGTINSRTATATVAGKTFTVSQAAPVQACTYSISPASASVAATATSGTITVTTQAGCSWSATSASSFVTFVQGTDRTGSGSVSYSVAANPTTTQRTGTATVAGKTFSVSQAGTQQACTYAINPTSLNMTAAGGTGTISITTQAGCAWSATSFSSFMTFQNAAGRTGPGVLEFTLTPNAATTLRTAVATVATKTFTVAQSGTVASCSYSVTPTNVSVPAAATTGSITVTTQNGCAWTATSLSPFVTFQNGTGRSGSGSVDYSVAENDTTTIRSGFASVATTTFVVSQAAAQAPAPEPGASPWSSDFDGDGRNDLLVHDSTAGGVEAWLLDGSTVKGTQPLSHSMDTNWKLVGRGDFNGDGKPDLVWQHRTQGSINLWYMDGTTRTGVATPSIQTDPEWDVVGVGDFNADGKPDLAWQHSGDGALAVWQMNGATVTDTVSLVPDRTTDLLWKVVGIGDFNADGKSDLVWRHMGLGDVGVWLMNGVTRIIHSPLNPWAVTDQQWQIGAVTDVNGDGKPDLVWEHANGSVLIWQMNGTSRVSSPSLSRTVPLGWHIVGPK